MIGKNNMYLELSDDRKVFESTLDRLFAVESTTARVRAALPLGFDPHLWAQLGELGVFGARAAAGGGLELSLLDALIVAEQCG